MEPRRHVRAGLRRRLLVGWAAALVVAGTGCGSPSSSPPDASATPLPTGASASDSAPPPSTATDSPGPAPASTTALPGEPYEQGPAAGQRLAVVGVAAGSSLRVRAHPGTDAPTVANLGPLTTGVIATGRSRLLPASASPGTGSAPGSATGSATGSARPSVWAEVTVSGRTGWALVTHLALPADTTDLTAEVIGRLGRRPTSETMLDLGMEVAQAYVSAEPPSTVTASVAPTVGDLGEITVDVVGLGDDSVAAQRLHVFGTPGEESFTLKSVEGTPFCYRGVSAAGLCL